MRDWPEIRDAVEKLCERFPGEYWRALDRERTYSTEFVAALTDAGYLSILVPEEFGGSGLPISAAAAVLVGDPLRRLQRRRLPRADVYDGHGASFDAGEHDVVADQVEGQPGDGIEADVLQADDRCIPWCVPLRPPAIVKPAHIHITSAPQMRKENVFRTNWVSASIAACTAEGVNPRQAAIATATGDAAPRSRQPRPGRSYGRRAFRDGAVFNRFSLRTPTAPGLPASHKRKRAIVARWNFASAPMSGGWQCSRMLLHGRNDRYHMVSAARVRRMRRLIFPELVSGNSSTNSTTRGYLYAARLRLTWSWSSRTSPSPGATPGITRT